MKVQFISQACVIIHTDDCSILCDPWLSGTAFNDSWKLFPEPQWENSNYDKITHLWVSHEHPDHFHFPTLKSMPQDFKDRVMVLFQKNNSDKIPNAFKQLGFKNVTLLQNRKTVNIAPKTKVYNHQVGQMDSALAVITDKYKVLNLNDCEANESDCKRFVADLGKIDVVLNQFSMAGYGGHIDYKTYLPKRAQQVLNTMLDDHKNLGVTTTIPFASYIYFCCEDNKHINDYGNTPRKVYDTFVKHGYDYKVLYINDIYDLDNTDPKQTELALQKYDALYAKKDELVFTKPDVIPYEKIEQAFLTRRKQLQEKFPSIILNNLSAVNIKVPDSNMIVKLSIADGTFAKQPDNADYDLIINSQPLFFAFNFTWGLQTLGVSGRWLCKSKAKVWRWYRIITSLNNAEIYLKPKYFFSKNNINFIKERLDGGLGQVISRLQKS